MLLLFCSVAKKRKKKDSKGKGTRKRLKKKYELSESENDGVTSLKNRSRNCVLIVESDEDDQKPISSLLGNAKTDSEAFKRLTLLILDWSSFSVLYRM